MDHRLFFSTTYALLLYTFTDLEAIIIKNAAHDNIETVTESVSVILIDTDTVIAIIDFSTV